MLIQLLLRALELKLKSRGRKKWMGLGSISSSFRQLGELRGIVQELVSSLRSRIEERRKETEKEK